jgi:hypothetical protein
MEQSFTKVLCRINLDRAVEGYDITFEGAKPKLCTGYLRTDNFTTLVALPIRELIKQGVSLHCEDLDWYDKGDVLIEDRPCKYFLEEELDILCS